MDLLKINSNGEEIIRMSGKEVEKINSIDNFNKIENTKNTETPENSEIPKNPEGVKGGFAIVSDPIYKLTYEEEKGLGAAAL